MYICIRVKTSIFHHFCIFLKWISFHRLIPCTEYLSSHHALNNPFVNMSGAFAWNSSPSLLWKFMASLSVPPLQLRRYLPPLHPPLYPYHPHYEHHLPHSQLLSHFFKGIAFFFQTFGYHNEWLRHISPGIQIWSKKGSWIYGSIHCWRYFSTLSPSSNILFFFRVCCKDLNTFCCCSNLIYVFLSMLPLIFGWYAYRSILFRTVILRLFYILFYLSIVVKFSLLSTYTPLNSQIYSSHKLICFTL